jgi:hypothetical protein
MLNSGYIAYAIIEVRGRNAGEISARMGLAAKIAAENGAVTDAMVSGLLVISRGTVPDPDKQKKTEPFTFLLVKILDQLQDGARIAYGSEFADFGRLGGETRFAYSFIAPSFGKALSGLLSTDFGKFIEIT